jgi:hypothetical protein
MFQANETVRFLCHESKGKSQMALDSPSATPSRTSNGMIPSPRKVALGSEGLLSPIMQAIIGLFAYLAIDKLQVWVENSGIKCTSWFYLIDNSLAQFKTLFEHYAILSLS